jgi:hypothetical protein
VLDAVDADAHDDHSAAARQVLTLDQDAGDLAAVEQQVVGPFEREPRGRNVARRGVEQYDAGEQRQRLCGRILRCQPDEAADVEVSWGRRPRPALAPAPGGLPLCPEPQALGIAGRGAFGDRVVGRAGLGKRDVADRRRNCPCGQNSAFAASKVAALSEGIAR